MRHVLLWYECGVFQGHTEFIGAWVWGLEDPLVDPNPHFSMARVEHFQQFVRSFFDHFWAKNMFKPAPWTLPKIDVRSIFDAGAHQQQQHAGLEILFNRFQLLCFSKTQNYSPQNYRFAELTFDHFCPCQDITLLQRICSKSQSGQRTCLGGPRWFLCMYVDVIRCWQPLGLFVGVPATA